MKVVDVRALPDYNISVVFANGVTGSVNLKKLTQSGIFQVLQDESLFQRVYTNGESIAWSEDLEIDGDQVYADIIDIDPTKLFTKSFHYATD